MDETTTVSSTMPQHDLQQRPMQMIVHVTTDSSLCVHVLMQAFLLL